MREGHSTLHTSTDVGSLRSPSFCFVFFPPSNRCLSYLIHGEKRIFLENALVSVFAKNLIAGTIKSDEWQLRRPHAHVSEIPAWARMRGCLGSDYFRFSSMHIHFVSCNQTHKSLMWRAACSRSILLLLHVHCSYTYTALTLTCTLLLHVHCSYTYTALTLTCTLLLYLHCSYTYTALTLTLLLHCSYTYTALILTLLLHCS